MEYHMPYGETFMYSDMTGLDPDYDGFLDPTLTTGGNMPNHLLQPGNPPQMNRYLMDTTSAEYLSSASLDTMFSQVAVHRNTVIYPNPPVGLPRQSSPSSNHPLSTCSSDFSPHTEGDYYHDRPPLTPPDFPALSPGHDRYDTWSPGGQLYNLAGLAESSVKPMDVFQEQFPAFYAEPNQPNFFPRGYSMSSDDSTCDLKPTSQIEPGPIPRQMSPESLGPVKDEIRVQDNTIFSFAEVKNDDESPLGEDSESLPVGNDDHDEEYKPGRHRRAISSVSRSARAKKRPAASPKPMTGPKRQKITSTAAARGKPALTGGRKNFTCAECPEAIFTDEAGLDKHVKTQHTRPFTCVFHFAGCESTFASKNEWKRHVASQHLLLNYWLCQQDACAKVQNLSKPAGPRGRSNSTQSTINCAPQLPNGTIFNRKDLYTQHVRRMHIPPAIKKQVKQNKTVPEWEDRVRQYQDEAHKIRCDLPEHMECPAANCTVQFDSGNAWDDRMEHVAKHLEKGETVIFGGDHDPTLVEWAARPDVSVIHFGEKGTWELHNPLKPGEATRAKKAPATEGESDEDAEGEDE